LSDCIGIEIPRKEKEPVYLSELIKDEKYRNSQAQLPVLLGETVVRSAKVIDLTKMPHLLLAGASEQGQTEALRSILLSLLWKKSPDEMKLVLIDTKGDRLTPFRDLVNSRLAIVPDGESMTDEKVNSVVTNTSRAEKVLSSLNTELEERYEALVKAHVSNMKEYNSKFLKNQLSPADGFRRYPYLVCVCDDYAELVLKSDKQLAKSIQALLLRLAQKGRAVGIHLILSTQRTCVDVISAIVKCNFTARLAFMVASRIDSMTVIDCPGAEKLMGEGDVLFSEGCDCERLQIPICDEGTLLQEISLMSKNETGFPYYLPDNMPVQSKIESCEEPEDPLYSEAERLVIMKQTCSTTLLQRQLGLGFARASRLVTLLNERGIISGEPGAWEVIKDKIETDSICPASVLS